MKLWQEYMKRHNEFVKRWGWKKHYGMSFLAMVIAMLPTSLVMYPLAKFDFVGKWVISWILLITFHTIIYYKHFYNEFLMKKKIKVKSEDLQIELYK